jgi:hypothetical protein
MHSPILLLPLLALLANAGNSVSYKEAPTAEQNEKGETTADLPLAEAVAVATAYGVDGSGGYSDPLAMSTDGKPKATEATDEISLKEQGAIEAALALGNSLLDDKHLPGNARQRYDSSKMDKTEAVKRYKRLVHMFKSFANNLERFYCISMVYSNEDFVFRKRWKVRKIHCPRTGTYTKV